MVATGDPDDRAGAKQESVFMKSKIKLIVMVTVAVMIMQVWGGGVSAQTNFTGGIHFNAGFPQKELKDHIGQNAYGLGGQIFYSPHNSPFAVGLELGWMNYGTETRSEPFSPSIPDVTVDVETSNNIAQAFFILRGMVPSGPIQLYADGLIGLNYMFTETSIRDQDETFKEVVSSTNRDDAAFSYGVGGGVMISLYNRKAGPFGKKAFQVLLDGGVRYIYGGEAEYLKKGSITRVDDQVIYDSIISKTDMVRLHAGVMFRF
jgi:hypothetical protein